MNQRLTIDIRKQIVKAAMTAQFKDREAALEQAKLDLADAIYEAEYSQTEKIAKRLPENWQSSSSSILIRHPDFTWRCDSMKMDDLLRMSRTRLMPTSNREVKIGAGHTCIGQVKDLVDMHNALRRDKEALGEKLRAIVASVNTTKQLLELWPEGTKFIPNAAVQTTALVPVGLVADVNRLMGLAA